MGTNRGIHIHNGYATMNAARSAAVDLVEQSGGRCEIIRLSDNTVMKEVLTQSYGNRVKRIVVRKVRDGRYGPTYPMDTAT